MTGVTTMDEGPDSQWLRDAIRSSFQATPWTSTDDIYPMTAPPQTNDPKFRKILQGVIFSRRFILSYQLVLLAIIVVSSAVYWSDQALRWRRRRNMSLLNLNDEDAYDNDAIADNRGASGREELSDVESSSPTTTLHGSGMASPKDHDANEDTPLLHQGHELRPLTPRRSFFKYLKAMLMYQPRPVPIINKTLPDNGTTCVILLFTGLNIFYILFHISFDIEELFVFADRAGLVFVANLPILYLLAAKNQPLRLLTGYSYESLNIVHRRLGEILCLTAFIHTSGMVGVWYTLLRPTGFSFLRFILVKRMLIGLFAFASYEMLYFTSLASFRQWWYELFLGTHVVLQAAALVLLWFHHSGCRVYVGIALCIFLIDRLVYRFGLKSFTTTAEILSLEDGTTVSLLSRVELRKKSILASVFGANLQYGWKAGDHAFITVPSLARKHFIQAHPFTISSEAPAEGGLVGQIGFTIRAHDGFSADLLRVCETRKALSLRLDGPYGSSHVRDVLEDSEIDILVAGGSGIAVCWPLVHFLLNRNSSGDPEQVWKSAKPKHQIHLVWIIHRTSHLSWIGQEALAKAQSRGVKMYLPPATDDAGRPDVAAIVTKIINEAGVGKRFGVVGSGPDSMGRCIRNTCANLTMQGNNIDVVIEKFGW